MIRGDPVIIYASHINKAGYGFPMVVVSILPLADFGPSDYHEGV